MKKRFTFVENAKENLIEKKCLTASATVNPTVYVSLCAQGLFKDGVTIKNLRLAQTITGDRSK